MRTRNNFQLSFNVSDERRKKKVSTWNIRHQASGIDMYTHTFHTTQPTNVASNDSNGKTFSSSIAGIIFKLYHIASAIGMFVSSISYRLNQSGNGNWNRNRKRNGNGSGNQIMMIETIRFPCENYTITIRASHNITHLIQFLLQTIPFRYIFLFILSLLFPPQFFSSSVLRFAAVTDNIWNYATFVSFVCCIAFWMICMLGS